MAEYLDKTGLSYFWGKIKDKLYPVGSIYMSLDSTSPASLFGGTWEQLKDRFLVGAGNSYEVSATGGEATHKLTVSELPERTVFSFEAPKTGTVSHSPWETTTVTAGTYISSSVVDSYITYGNIPKEGLYSDGGESHENMPPYLAVTCGKELHKREVIR